MKKQFGELFYINAYDILHNNLITLRNVGEQVQAYALGQATDADLLIKLSKEISLACTNMEKLEEIINNRFENLFPETPIGKELVDIVRVLRAADMSEDDVHTILFGYFHLSKASSFLQKKERTRQPYTNG